MPRLKMQLFFKEDKLMFVYRTDGPSSETIEQMREEADVVLESCDCGKHPLIFYAIKDRVGSQAITCPLCRTIAHINAG